MPLYDSIGAGYAKTRSADRRIVSALVDALGLPADAVVLDVGSGSGKYARALADHGFNVVAIEPSEVMRAQGLSHPRVRLVAAAAEEIPLPSDSAQGAFIVLALHHFADRAKALGEILRVIRKGPLVIFTFEPRALKQFWLADYFPRLGSEIPSSFAELPDVAKEVAALTGRAVRVIPFPLPRDLEDKFAAAGWATPERYLDADIRRGISSFALMPEEEVSTGLARLKSDLSSGAWDSRYSALRCQEYYDAGYRFIVAEKGAD